MPWRTINGRRVKIESLDVPYKFNPNEWPQYKKYWNPEYRLILGIPPLPKHVYHYTSSKKAKQIQKLGLIPQDSYHPGDMPIIWFFPEDRRYKDDENSFAYGEVEIEVNTSDVNDFWIQKYGGIPKSIVYPDWIPPSKLSFKRVR
jgi:hypothetical protein